MKYKAMTLKEFTEEVEDIIDNCGDNEYTIQTFDDEPNNYRMTISQDTDGYFEDLGSTEDTYYFTTQDDDTICESYICGKAKTIKGLYTKYKEFINSLNEREGDNDGDTSN